ncbi:MAG: hypothetical protein Q8P20_00425 [bacterium]|nr:hypothetical protein [bacterium]
MSNFLATFIATCVQSGNNSTLEMCQSAQSRIKEINKDIKRIEDLREEKINLYAAIKHLGGSVKEQKAYKYIDFSIPENQLADNYRVLCINICDIIEQNSNGLLTSDLIEELSKKELASLEDNEQLYFAIKWLAGRLIIDKDQSLNLIKGKNWDNRPINVN